MASRRPNTPVSITTCLAAGTHWFFVAPDFDGPTFDCGADYTARLECVGCNPTRKPCCLPDGSCLGGQSEDECQLQGGGWQPGAGACPSVTCPQPQDNDECADAEPIAVGGSASGSTVLATADVAPFCGAIDGTGGGVWYSVIGNGNTLKATLCNGTDYDSKIRVFCSDCAAPLCVSGNDDSCDLQSETSWCSEAGVEYLILVHGFGSHTGNYQLDILDGAACNDAICDGCGNAVATNVGVLSVGSTIAGSTSNSLNDFPAGCNSDEGGRDEVFEFSVNSSGFWTFDSCTVPACWDTTLEIREETGSGCFGDFVACNGDGCNVCYYESAVSAFLSTGTTYYLIVDGWSSSAFGDFTITTSRRIESPVLARPPHDILKNRYISIDPRGAGGSRGGLNFDIRVTLTSSLVNGVTTVGSSWWANAPDEDCISIVTATRPASPPDWSACPTVHLTGCPIIPTSTYFIVAVDGSTESDPALAAATQAKPDPKWWGDCVGRFTGTEWTPPNRATNIDDAVATIKTFQENALNATHVSVTDLEPALNGSQINKIVNFNDVLAAILGFKGEEYPGPQIELCPDP